MKILLQGVVGSTAYGLDTPSSDIDRLGIFAADTQDVLGLDVVKTVQETKVTKDPDTCLHEVGKYLSLALKSNPSILELLWLEGYEITSIQGNWIRERRSEFLSKRVAMSYGAYVRQQAYKLDRREAQGKQGFDSDLAKRTPKHARHCWRLLLQGAQLLQHGDMSVRLNETDRLWCFAAGELAETDPAEFRKVIADQMVWFEEVAAKSQLPEEPNRKLANEMLQVIRRDFLK